MVTIHHSILPILGIWSLLILIIAKEASAGRYKERSPIDLDTACAIQQGIGVNPSNRGEGSKYYYLKSSFLQSFRLGLVAHGNQVLLPGNESDIERFVFYLPWRDGRLYIRVVRKFVGPRGRILRKVDEFYRIGHGEIFNHLDRKTIDIDVLDQEDTSIIQVEELSTGGRRFSIREERCTDYAIGRVKYGKFTISRRTNGIIDRNVIWDGGIVNPQISVISRYDNGTCVVTKHSYAGAEVGFVQNLRRASNVFLGPVDEEIVIQ